MALFCVLFAKLRHLMTINSRFFSIQFLFVLAVHGLPARVRFFFLHFCCQRFCFCLAHVMADNIAVVICFVILLISNYLKIYNSDWSFFISYFFHNFLLAYKLLCFNLYRCWWNITTFWLK